jgi:hypothetical protein
MRLLKYLSVVILAGALASCSQEGPAGPIGPSGPSGVANINTLQYTVGSGGWSSVSGAWVATFSEPDITDNNTDAVEAYWSNASSGWIALPFSNINITGDQVSYGFNNGTITFSYYGNSNPPDYYTNTATLYFKVTVIPPSIQVKYPKINWRNASEAAQVPEVQQALAK